MVCNMVTKEEVQDEQKHSSQDYFTEESFRKFEEEFEEYLKTNTSYAPS